MSDTVIKLTHDPYPGEWWELTSRLRIAVLDTTTTEPPVLQVAWRSSYGRIEWRQLETAVVNRSEYDAK